MILKQIMDLKAIYRLRIFSLEDVMDALSITKPSAAKLLQRLQDKGIVQHIRKNLYTTIDLASGQPLADKYEVGSSVSPTSYIGWHTALEFHGMAHQVFYNAYVGSESRFNRFTFGGTEFEHCVAPIAADTQSGVITPIHSPHVRVTDLERTFVDCCDRLDRSGGAGELVHCLEGIVILDEDKLRRYLQLYGKAFLYQKTGFMLERIQAQAHISDELIDLCRKQAGNSVKRLTNASDSTHYVSRWKLYVPNDLMTTVNNNDYAII